MSTGSQCENLFQWSRRDRRQTAGRHRQGWNTTCEPSGDHAASMACSDRKAAAFHPLRIKRIRSPPGIAESAISEPSGKAGISTNRNLFLRQINEVSAANLADPCVR